MSFETSVNGKAFDLKLLKRVFKLVADRKLLVAIAFVLTVSAALIGPYIPTLIQKTIDRVIITHNEDELLRWAAIILGMLLLQGVINYFQSYSTSHLGQIAIERLRNRTFKKVMGLKLSVFDRTPVGVMITRTISDVEAVADVFAEGLISIAGDILQIAVILIIMFTTDWRLSLVALAIFPLLLVASYIFKEKVRVSFQHVRNQVSKLNAFTQEHITGMQVVQAFGREEEELRRFTDINAKHRDANIKSILYYSIFFPVIEVFSAIAVALIVWYGAKGLIAGEIAFGVITMFILLINLLFRPIRQIADKFNTLQMGMVASERIFNVLDMKDEMPDKGTLIGPLQGKVEYRDVWFAYNNEDWILKGVSFSIPQGRTLAIVGHTGSGKSSIISLINRLYPYQKGAILIDDQPLEAYKIAALQKGIAVVLQDVFLFSDTIDANIRLYNPEITHAQILEAAKLIGAHKFIERMPGGYEYSVQERGNTLSTGQRQLISLLRAIVQDPAILILDEATSSVDQETEEMIQRATDLLLHDRTAIVIAHRLATIRGADHIIVLEKGVIKEQGTHRELLDNRGLYGKLYALQFGAPENEAQPTL